MYSSGMRRRKFPLDSIHHVNFDRIWVGEGKSCIVTSAVLNLFANFLSSLAMRNQLRKMDNNESLYFTTYSHRAYKNFVDATCTHDIFILDEKRGHFR